MGVQENMKLVVSLSIIALLILLIIGKFRASSIFLSVSLLYYLLGYLSFESYLSSYISDSLIVLVLLLLVSIAIEKSSLISYASKFLITKSYHISLLRLGIFTSFVSAFLNNTAVVSTIMGVIKNNKLQAPSKLLIPLSYFSIVGGSMSLIGTSTNLVVNSFVVQNGLESLAIFDFFIVGFCISVGVLFVMLALSFLLPNYKELEHEEQEYLISAKVLNTSSMIGKSIKDNSLRNLEYLFLIEIERNGQSITPISHDEIIQAGDILIFSGDVAHIDVLQEFSGLEVGESNKIHSLEIVDVVISPQSNLIGKSVKDSKFRAKFDASIIALKRGSQNISKIGQTILKAGDRLILGVGREFKNRDNISKNFYIISSVAKSQKLNKAFSFLVVFLFF